MASAAQALANAANAQKSTGPRTEAGKSKSKNNSMAHGLNAEAATLFSHSPLLAEEFEQFRRTLLSNPVDDPICGADEELTFERWAFSAFQAGRARTLEAMAESDLRMNFGEEYYERRWHRFVQTRLRLDREADAARKIFYDLYVNRLIGESNEAEEERQMEKDRIALEKLKLQALERHRVMPGSKAAKHYEGLIYKPNEGLNPIESLALVTDDPVTQERLYEAYVATALEHEKGDRLIGR